MIAGRSSLQRLGMALPVTRPVWDANLGPPASESRPLATEPWVRLGRVFCVCYVCYVAFLHTDRTAIRASKFTWTCLAVLPVLDHVADQAVPAAEGGAASDLAEAQPIRVRPFSCSRLSYLRHCCLELLDRELFVKFK